MLAGDVGGTQIRFSIFNLNKDSNTPIHVWHKYTKDSTSLADDIIAAVNDAVKVGVMQLGTIISAAVLGIAGPVDESLGIAPLLVDIP